ncbi:MAG: LacI family DNA-binding transcriptional regulator [Lachnospiraceae bacterium]|nr:LacI family DNA-binding transcriptional regulator [Lachnospiraceae bacterium]
MAGTMKQIAELSGVSRGTVDRVLNNRGRVRDEVAEKVRRIADEIGYHTRAEKKIAARGYEDRPAQVTRRIGVVTQLSDASFMIAIRRGLGEAAREAKAHGIEVVVRECPGVVEAEQCAAIDELEEFGIDALAIMPVECDGVRTRLQHLIRDRGIHVVTFNTDIVGVERTAFIGMDNEQGGRAAAGLLGTLMRGSGSALGIIGSFSNSTNLGRINGFSRELSESFPGITLMGVTPSMDRQDSVESIIIKALVSNPDLGGIAMVSSGQLGIKDALSDPEVRELLAGRKENERPYIIIYDLTPKNRQLLEEGLVDFVIDQDGYTQGYRSVMLLVGLLEGEEKPEKKLLYTDITIRTKYTSS